jgi:hypothetical protein
MLNQMWNFNLADHEEEFREDLREASGIGKRGKGKGKRKRVRSAFAGRSHLLRSL